MNQQLWCLNLLNASARNWINVEPPLSTTLLIRAFKIELSFLIGYLDWPISDRPSESIWNPKLIDVPSTSKVALICWKLFQWNSIATKTLICIFFLSGQIGSNEGKRGQNRLESEFNNKLESERTRTQQMWNSRTWPGQTYFWNYRTNSDRPVLRPISSKTGQFWQSMNHWF